MKKAMNTSRTVLVVDDSRVARLAARQFILGAHPDWIVEEASTGEEALEKVRADCVERSGDEWDQPPQWRQACASAARMIEAELRRAVHVEE